MGYGQPPTSSVGRSLITKTRLTHTEKDEIIHLLLSEESEARSVELGPNITAELNDKGQIIGIEILRASKLLRDFILESARARLLAGQGNT